MSTRLLPERDSRSALLIGSTTKMRAWRPRSGKNAAPAAAADGLRAALLLTWQALVVIFGYPR